MFFVKFSSNDFFSETAAANHLKFYRDNVWEVLYQVCSNHVDSTIFSIFDEFYHFFVKFSSNDFFSETAAANHLKFYRDNVWEVLYQVCSNHVDSTIFQFLKNFFNFFVKFSSNDFLL